MEYNNKDLSFTEWQNLSYSDKREIWNNYWNPYAPEIGLQTKKRNR